MTIEQIKAKLDRIENSGDWNIDEKVISFINKIIDDIPLPTSIMPTSSNSIQLEYDLVRKYVELEVFPDKVLITFAPKICDWSKGTVDCIPNGRGNVVHIMSAMNNLLTHESIDDILHEDAGDRL